MEVPSFRSKFNIGDKVYYTVLIERNKWEIRNSYVTDVNPSFDQCWDCSYRVNDKDGERSFMESQIFISSTEARNYLNQK